MDGRPVGVKDDDNERTKRRRPRTKTEGRKTRAREKEERSRETLRGRATRRDLQGMSVQMDRRMNHRRRKTERGGRGDERRGWTVLQTIMDGK